MPFLTPGGNAAFFYQQFFVTPKLDPNLSFTGQTVIVTGSNVGLGFSAAEQIAQRGASKLILAVRSVSKGEEAAARIRASLAKSAGPTRTTPTSSTSTSPSIDIEVWPLDLGSYQSVKDFAVRAKKLDRLDVLLENAGLQKAKFELKEEDEETITVNVVSTALLAFMLLPKLRETAERFGVLPHVVIVSSETAFFAKFEERKAENIFEKLADPRSDMSQRYFNSKLIENYFVRELASRISSSTASPPVVINTVNPGFCKSSFFREPGTITFALRIFMLLVQRKTEVGARNFVYAAAAGPTSHGKYLSDCKVHPSPCERADLKGELEKVQKRVWDELVRKLEKIEPGVTGCV